MNVSIRDKIYWSFSLLVLIFVVNGIASIVTINNNRKLYEDISGVLSPALESAGNLEDLLVKSKMRTTNWVFLRSDQEDKDALIILQDSTFPLMKLQLHSLFLKVNDKQMSDSLDAIFAGFEHLILMEKKMMGSLQKFEDYDDPVKKMEAERIVEDELLPRTATLTHSLHAIIFNMQQMVSEKNVHLNRSFIHLRILITILAISIIFLGIFLAAYKSRIIITPINKIRNIINDLGKGITRKVDYPINNDEIGEMVRSVNNLSEKLQVTAAFATEVGNRNFQSFFAPLSAEDTLGMALVAMRDNIKQTDEKLNDAQHIAHLGSMERDVETGKIYLSDEMFNILDIDPASFDYDVKNIFMMILPEYQEEFRDYRTAYLAGHEAGDFECRMVTPKGVIKNIIIKSKTIADANGKAIRIIGIVQDITERKRGEEKLAEERELFRLMIENIPGQIYLKDTKSRFMLCNKSVAANAGYASQVDMIGKTDFDFYSASIAEQYFIEEQTILQSGIPIINHEEHLTDKVTGESRWGQSTKLPFRNSVGNIIGLIGINHDITDRKIAEKELETVNRELSILFNSIDEIFFSVNMVTLKVIQVSATCEKLYGYAQADFMANYMLWLDIIHPDDKHVVATEDEEMRRGEKISNQYRIIRKDKMIRWVETRITPTLDDDGNLIRVDGITRDITDRRNAEKELHKSEERYRQIVETAQEGIWLIDEDNCISFFNKKMCEILGYSAEEMKGKRLFDFMDEEGRNNASSQIENRKQKINGNYDVKYITKSGKPIWTNISTNSIFDEDGQYNGALAMVTDITQRKSDEELLHQSELDLAIKNKELERKNKELEQFAYVASHDLQEPLSTTISFVELFRQKYEGKLDARADAYLAYIVQASGRMKVLIKDLLDFSRIGHSKDFERADCNVILRNVIADLDKIIKDSGAKINSAPLPVLTGYSTELKQLFQNLVVNSIKFRKKNAFPQINITARKNNDYWQFAFSDNGIGIDQQYNERIFIIFQRLHNRSEYAGSGIGLSHCKKIVELHRGKIWVESTPNEGSTFYFTIHSPKEKINEAEIKLHHAHR